MATTARRLSDPSTAGRRADIITAARDAYAEYGYARASLRSIAERAGITHAGVLHHFANKDELLTAVLVQRDLDDEQRGHQLDPSKDLHTALMDLTRQLAAEHQTAPELMRLWLEVTVAASRATHPAHDYYTHRYRKGRDEMERLLSQIMRTPENEDSPTAAQGAQLFMALSDGLQIQWLLDPTLDITSTLTSFFTTLVKRANGDPKRATQ